MWCGFWFSSAIHWKIKTQITRLSFCLGFDFSLFLCVALAQAILLQHRIWNSRFLEFLMCFLQNQNPNQKMCLLHAVVVCLWMLTPPIGETSVARLHIATLASFNLTSASLSMARLSLRLRLHWSWGWGWSWGQAEAEADAEAEAEAEAELPRLRLRLRPCWGWGWSWIPPYTKRKCISYALDLYFWSVLDGYKFKPNAEVYFLCFRFIPPCCF